MTNRGLSDRRDFLQMFGLGVAGFALSNTGLRAAPAKPLRGLFPIGFTPFTPDNKIDLEGLAAQVKFCNRGGVHGLMWPQNASGWTNLSDQERLDGNEAVTPGRPRNWERTDSYPFLRRRSPTKRRCWHTTSKSAVSPDFRSSRRPSGP